MSSRSCTVLVATLLLAACNGQQTADQISADSAITAQQATQDADIRAQRLAEESLRLDAQAAHATGARRQALQHEAGADLTDAAGVEQQGEDDAGTIDDAAEKKIQASDHR